MSVPTVVLYVKELTEEQIKSVQEPYYKKEALKELVDASVNPAARELLISSYTKEYSTWKSAMDKLEKDVLGEWYQGFVYDFTITFGDNKITLQAQYEDAGLMANIESYLKIICGFKTTTTKTPGPLKRAEV